MVLARAMVADLTTGYAGVRALSLMMTIHGVTPVVAPAVGGVLAAFLPWRGVLGVFAVVVAVQLVVAAALLRETLPPERRTPRLRYGDLGRVLRRPGFLAYGLTVGFGVASVMAYVASSSFVYQQVLGFGPVTYGLSFTLNAVGMTLAGLANARLARRRVHPARTASYALPGVLLSCLAVTAAAASPWPVLLVVPIFTNAVCANLVMGNCMGLTMQHAGGLPGAASAMLGLFMFGLSALVSPLAGLFGGAASAVPMGIVMSGAAIASATSFGIGRSWVARHPESEVAFA
jgi:DHA1 family bicyclomycin/chloramphenicol resistance-like MFS transporter